MNYFSERLKDLMFENNLDVKSLAHQLDLTNTSTVYNWLRDEKGVSINTAVTIANYFSCSLDFLFARSEDDKKFISTKTCPAFDEQFRKVLFDRNVTQYRLIKDKIISRGNLNNWLNKKHSPHMESIIKLADYLNITIDELVGRE